MAEAVGDGEGRGRVGVAVPDTAEPDTAVVVVFDGAHEVTVIADPLAESDSETGEEADAVPRGVAERVPLGAPLGVAVRVAFTAGVAVYNVGVSDRPSSSFVHAVSESVIVSFAVDVTDAVRVSQVSDNPMVHVGVASTVTERDGDTALDLVATAVPALWDIAALPEDDALGDGGRAVTVAPGDAV